MNRREFIRSLVATTTLVAVAATGVFEIAQKEVANQKSAQLRALQLQLPSQASTTQQNGSQTSQSTSQTSATAPPGYVLVAQLSSLSGKSSAYFTHPTFGQSMLLSLNGQWKAFSATCTHRPCTVEYSSSEIYCPCHGAAFSPSNGSVLQGPAQVALGEYGVLVENGEVFVSDSVIN